MATGDDVAGMDVKPTPKEACQKHAPGPTKANTLLPDGAIPLSTSSARRATAIKRTKDPLGLLPDHVSINPDDDSTEAKVAWQEKFDASTPHARVKRLQEHPHAGIKNHADELHARLLTEVGLPLANGLHLPPGVHHLSGEDIPELMSAIAEAETAALYFHAECLPARALRENAKKGGAAKQEKNPIAREKQEAKDGAHALWLERHSGEHKNLRTVEQFAIEVMRRWPVLTSSQVIRKWSAQWSRETR